MKSQNYCFTINNYTEEDLESCKNLKYNYIIIGDEIGENQTRHLQGYINFRNQVHFTALKKKIPRAHIEKCKGNAIQNINYCSKDSIIYEDGNKPGIQGKRTDLEKVKEIVLDTGKMRDVVLEATSYQSVRMAEKILEYHEKKRNWKPIVKWYYGPTGSGKSKLAYEESPDGYTAGESNKWWQGYDAHENVIIDDFRKDFIKFHELLKLLDRYPYLIECKGGSRQFLAKKIIITSPFHPEEIYNTREDIEQLLRRIDEIKEII